MGITYMQFRSGRPILMPYTPPSVLVNAGDVVVVDNIPLIAHTDIAISEFGELACGQGVYIGPAAGAIPIGADVYWDTVNFNINVNSSVGPKLGMCLAGPTGQLSGAGPANLNDNCYFLHAPGSNVIGVGSSTAAAGSIYTNAGTLPSFCKIYPTTGSDGTKGVSINLADQRGANEIFIGNGVSNHPLIVYPPVGSTINGAAANAGYTGTSGAGVWAVCLSGTGPWFCE